MLRMALLISVTYMKIPIDDFETVLDELAVNYKVGSVDRMLQTVIYQCLHFIGHTSHRFVQNARTCRLHFVKFHKCFISEQKGTPISINQSIFLNSVDKFY